MPEHSPWKTLRQEQDEADLARFKLVVQKIFPQAHGWKSFMKEDSNVPHDDMHLWTVNESTSDNNLEIGYGPTEYDAWAMAKTVATVLFLRGKRIGCGATPPWAPDGEDISCTLSPYHDGLHTSLFSPSWEGDHRPGFSRQKEAESV